MNHRHLDVPEATAPEELPSAAIVDLLERGDLNDWQPLAVAIARRPDGELAERVEHLVDTFPLYGTSTLWRAFLDRCRAMTEGLRSSPELHRLAELRRARGLTQVEVAARMGISQSDVSKLERRSDLRLSTLRAYAKALGGRLSPRVAFDTKADIELEASPPDPDRALRPGRRPGRGAADRF